MARAAPFQLQIISGFRTEAEQAALEAAGAPTAADERSTHRSCPATGADVVPGAVRGLSRPVEVLFGEAAAKAGLRWGGGSKPRRLVIGGRDTGAWIPSDWHHVDLGPRQ